MPKKILFIFHEDTRTGAPNALLSFLKYLKEHHSKDFIIDIFILRSVNGALEPELRKVARKVYIKRKSKSIKVKVTNIFKPTSLFLRTLHIVNKYDLIYGNTILSLKYVSALKQKFPKVKTLLYVHEGTYLTSLFLETKKATQQFSLIDKVFTVANQAKNNLIENYAVDSKKISIVYPTVTKTEVAEINNPLKSIYSNYELILVNIGQPILTKGTDLIPQIANELKKRNPELKFKIIIVGISNDSDYLKSLKLDISKMQLTEYIDLVPHTKTPMNYMEIANVCIIPAREESFSLIGVQAAQLKKPIVAFRNALGILDILDESCTFQANYLDIADFVNQVELVYKNPDLAAEKALLAHKMYINSLDADKINNEQFNNLNHFMHD